MLKSEFKFEESYFIVFYLELKKKLATSCGMWDGISQRGNGTHALSGNMGS